MQKLVVKVYAAILIMRQQITILKFQIDLEQIRGNFNDDDDGRVDVHKSKDSTGPRWWIVQVR